MISDNSFKIATIFWTLLIRVNLLTFLLHSFGIACYKVIQNSQKNHVYCRAGSGWGGKEGQLSTGPMKCRRAAWGTGSQRARL